MKSEKIVRLYDVSDLIVSDQSSASSFLSALLEAFHEYYREKQGTGGTVLLRNRLLVIWNYKESHEEVADYLKALRKVKNAKPRETDPTPIHRSLLLDEESHMAFLALQTPVTIAYELAPIERHLAKIASQAQLEYQVDDSDEEVAKKILDSLKEPYPFRIVKRPAIMAIERLLIRHRLDFTIDDGKLIITKATDRNQNFPTLFVNIDESSGWDSQSVADILQDAVDKGEWQDIDGQGGTITRPLNDVLMIQNHIPALYECLKTLNQLNRRPKALKTLALNPDHSAGKGRKAPNNDWPSLSESELIAIRLQADLLPAVDEVVCYQPKLYRSESAAETRELFKEKLHPLGMAGSVRLRGKEANEIANLWRNMSFHAHQELLTDVYLPWVELVFKREGRVVSRTSISWSMNTVLFKSLSGKYQRFDYDSRTGPARRLKERLIAHQAIRPSLLEDSLRKPSDSD